MKILIKNRLKNHKHFDIEIEDILQSDKILFSIFSRYGDGIISFKVIKEFIDKYPKKKYIILTSKQQLPYAKKIINQNDIKFLHVNKRNPINLYRTVNFLKKEKINLGFNPWGHGDDSEFFISYCKKFSFYKKFDNSSKTANLYDRVRKYLHLPIINNKILNIPILNNINKIIIAPISSDITKNINEQSLNILIKHLKKEFIQSSIIVALPREHKNMKIDVEKFIFAKNAINSTNFLDILLQSDLFVGVDSGPLHLALALNIDSIGVFGPTSPFTILDNNQTIKIYRDTKLRNTFCFVKNCTNPICIHDLFKNNMFNHDYCLDDTITLEEKECPVK